ncbi:hypothetical protein AQUCO_12000021v1 [Aquilegia coerulea]|uniref:Uncharacterized protein n=1 Tax=Aquilegia coerulea TaxID=218851 RepID=A0A2G5C1V7_AQUCA|nr:hypothetical protein AQUCO_12000021v1 [Aquilegia coerulea]
MYGFMKPQEEEDLTENYKLLKLKVNFSDKKQLCSKSYYYWGRVFKIEKEDETLGFDDLLKIWYCILLLTSINLSESRYFFLF